MMYIASNHTAWDLVLPCHIHLQYGTSGENGLLSFLPFLDAIVPYGPDSLEGTPVCEAARYAEEQVLQKSHDDWRPHHQFSHDNLLWLWVPPASTSGMSSKFVSRYHGPYRVLQRTSPVNHVIEPVTPTADLCRRCHETVRVDRLKPYHKLSVVMTPKVT